MERHAKMQAKCLILPNPEHTAEGGLYSCWVKCFQSQSTEAPPPLNAAVFTHIEIFLLRKKKVAHQDAKVITIF